MHKENLPAKVDPFRFAENAISLHGKLLIKNMQRLCASLASDSGEVEVGIEFGVDGQGIHYLRFHLEAQLVLQCQRCMESFIYGIIDDFVVGVVHTEEEAGRLPARYDPVVIKDGFLVIQDVVEDELMVSLPIVPMHDPKECHVTLPLVANSTSELAVEKESPFKVIEILQSKRKLKRNDSK